MLLIATFDTIRIAFILLKNIAKILININKRGIIHGDLHLDNIIINQYGEIYLIDFVQYIHCAPDFSAKILTNKILKL